MGVWACLGWAGLWFGWAGLGFSNRPSVSTSLVGAWAWRCWAGLGCAVLGIYGAKGIDYVSNGGDVIEALTNGVQ